MPIISGVLKDGAGQPIAGCTIQLKAVNTTSAVIMTTTARVGATAGEYRIDTLPARYEVTLAVEDYRPQKVGIIDVYADSPDGSLNDFLTATKVEYLTPDVMNQFKLLAQQSREAADQANVASQGISAIKDAAETAASGAALSEKNAAGSALAARTSEINAADSVTKAAASAVAALASQNAVKLSETNAGQSASDAALSATKAADAALRSGKSATDAAGHATDAQTAATNAATTAAAAKGDATKAAMSATEATAAKDAAVAQVTGFDTHVSQQITVITQAATTATTKANADIAAATDTSRNNAILAINQMQAEATSAIQVSKDAAGASAAAARVSETNAGASATAAALSAGNAATSATRADTKATEAANSAVKAEVSEKAAAASVAGTAGVIGDTQIGLPAQPVMLVSSADELSKLPTGAHRFARNSSTVKVLPTDNYVYLEVTGKRDAENGSCIKVVDYLDPGRVWTGIRNSVTEDAGFTWVRQRTAPDKLITAAADISRWDHGVNSPAGTPDWKITQGTPDTTTSLLIPTRTGAQWEIQHPVSVENMLRYGGRIRFGFDHRQSAVLGTEGKDVLEVRLFIPDGVIPPKITIPPATPDKPYLVLGFAMKVVKGRLRPCMLDTPEVFPWSNRAVDLFDIDVFSGLEVLFNSWTSCRIEHNGVYYGDAYLDRTGADMPVNTLCIRSGINPVTEVSFRYLGSVVLRENINHRLTMEDDGVTFYASWGHSYATSLTLPDIPFPEGFSVNLVSEGKSVIIIYPENKNVICVGDDGMPVFTPGTPKGKRRLIQTGKNGKTWLII